MPKTWQILAESKRGVELFQMSDGHSPNVLAAMFPFNPAFVESSKILMNFIELNVSRMSYMERDNHDAWYQWLVKEGSIGRLDIKTPPSAEFCRETQRQTSHSRPLEGTSESWRIGTATLPLCLSLTAALNVADKQQVRKRKIPKQYLVVAYRRGHANSHTYTYGKRSEELVAAAQQQRYERMELLGTDGTWKGAEAKDEGMERQEEGEQAAVPEEVLVEHADSMEAAATGEEQSAPEEGWTTGEEQNARIEGQSAPEEGGVRRVVLPRDGVRRSLSCDALSYKTTWNGTTWNGNQYPEWAQVTRRHHPRHVRSTMGDIVSPTCRLQKLLDEKEHRAEEGMEKNPVGCPWKREQYKSAYEHSRELKVKNRQQWLHDAFYPAVAHTPPVRTQYSGDILTQGPMIRFHPKVNPALRSVSGEIEMRITDREFNKSKWIAKSDFQATASVKKPSDKSPMSKLAGFSKYTRTVVDGMLTV